MSSTNYRKSNLSDSKYDYDLIVATTAKSINATMKRYLYGEGKNPEPIEIWYKKPSRAEPLEPMDPISGVDVYSLGKDSAIPQSLLDAKFAFAIRASIGSPEGVSGQKIPDIIQLSEDRQKVNYNLFFHSFEVAELQYDSDGPYMAQVKQPAGDPYIFKSTVDLNFDEADPESTFDDLDSATQEKLKNLNTSNMFSVQQLYLDLNTAKLQSLPKLEGLKEDSNAKTIIETKFINVYWQRLHNSKGGVVLGYAVKADHSIDPESSIQPTDLDFSVSPYYDQNGNKTDRYDLYTLNYLMRTQKRHLTLGAPFNWNWVNDDEDKDVHGAMAIRRSEFAYFLRDSLTKHLPLICINPQADISASTFSWKASSNFYRDDDPGSRIEYLGTPNPPGLVGEEYAFMYGTGESGGASILKFSYNKESKSDKKKKTIGIDSFNADAHYYLTSSSKMEVKVQDDKITIKIEGNMDVYFDPGEAFDMGNVEGRVGGYECEIVYQIAVDMDGRLTVKPEGDYKTPTLIGDDLDRSVMAGADGSTDFIEKVRKQYEGATGWVGAFGETVEKYLNESGNMWVFPGGKTFSFKEAAFSEYQDLICHIRYENPTT